MTDRCRERLLVLGAAGRDFHDFNVIYRDDPSIRADLDAAHCTAEEREEYEPYVEAGSVIFAGVDSAEILAEAEKEAQVLI